MKFLTPFLLIVISIAAFFMFIKPHYAQMNIYRGQIKQYDDAIARATSVLSKKDDLLNQKNGFTAEDLGRLKKALPDGVDNIRLIIDINNIAARYGTGIHNINVSHSSSPSPEAVDVSAPLYNPYTMSFVISMTYEQFLSFLRDLESDLRITDISSISFRPVDDSNTYDYSLSIVTYWLK